MTLDRWASSLGRHPDAIFAVLVGAILALLIVPLPPVVLDVLVAMNLAFATLILVVVLLAERPLALSTFPSLLLVTTLYRLALNVSTTRMILSRQSGGQVVEAFGRFVVGGDVIIGLVVFLVVTLVQLLVIGKGAGRVAEVGARFTLDALPGRQMTIDASVRSGALTEAEAEARRRDLQRESQFHGAMDGAMKFVKGDAVAGLVITGLNLGAGMTLGVLRHGATFEEAVERYAVLTVGDGLVSQLPALVITLAAGVLATRVATDGPRGDLGPALGRELLGQPKALAITAAFCFGLAVVPGVPAAPFIVLAAALGAGAFLHGRPAPARQTREALEQRVETARVQRAEVDHLAPAVAELALEIEAALAEALEIDSARPATSELVGDLLPQLRNAIFRETGVRVPGIAIRPRAPGLAPGQMVVRLREVPARRAVLNPERMLVAEPPLRLQRLGIAAEPIDHPVHGATVSSVHAADHDALVDAGCTCWTLGGIVALHLARVIRDHLDAFVGLHETNQMLEGLRQLYPTLVDDVVPEAITTAELAEVLKRLVTERVPIRDLKTILDTVSSLRHQDLGIDGRADRVRVALSAQIVHQCSNGMDVLGAVLVGEDLEERLRSLFDGSDPRAVEVGSRVVTCVAESMKPLNEAGARAVLLTSADVRRPLWRLLQPSIPELAVLSYPELPPRLSVQPVARLTLDDLKLAAEPPPMLESANAS